MTIPASPPGAKRATETIRFAVRDSALGLVLVARTATGLCAILLGDDPDALLLDLRSRFPHALLTAGDTQLQALADQVARFVESPSARFDAVLDMRGSDFQRDVWRALRDIAPGSTATYGDIAARIGRPAAVRAVARACAANPIAVVVPCHRVIRSDGQLAGYRWGVERKRELLSRETSA